MKNTLQSLLRFIVSVLVVTGIVFGVYRGITRGFFSQEVHPIFEEQAVSSMFSSAKNIPEEYFFDAENAGPLRLGMLISDIKTSASPWWIDVLLTRQNGALFEEYVAHDVDSVPLLRIVPVCSIEDVCRVKSIEILSSRFKTNLGIGVGSAYADLRETNISSNISHNGTSLLVQTSEGSVFVFSGSYAVAGKDFYAATDLPDRAVIESVILTTKD